jgi:glycosyltransferase involved in cell wall biosynthesis
VVLAVYERAEALDVVLRAYSEQEGPLPQVVVADDGSSDEIATIVERWRETLEIEHVWQPNEGFRKARMMNIGAEAASGDYLLFIDGDCVPRKRFLSAVRDAALPGWFLSTKRVLLGPAITRKILEEGVPAWRWSSAEWVVRAPGELPQLERLLPLRDRDRPWHGRASDFVPPVDAYTLIGVRREDFERVNGFEGRCNRTSDGEDQDMAIRLRRTGLRCAWPGPWATVLHLWHDKRSDHLERQNLVFEQTLKSDHFEAAQGLRELRAESGRL